MKIDLSQFRETFLQESADHLVEIETGLLQLTSAGADDETLNSIFRAAHSIKGGAGAFGLTDVVRFTHVLENLFDRMREHEVTASAELVKLLLRANDVLKELITTTDGRVPADTVEVREALQKAASEGASVQKSDSSIKQSGPPTHAANHKRHDHHPREDGESSYLVSFRPAVDLFSVGSDPLLLLRNLASLGRVASIEVDIATVPSLAALPTEVSYLGWEIEVITRAPQVEIDDVFEFVLDCATVRIAKRLESDSKAASEPPISNGTAAAKGPEPERDRPKETTHKAHVHRSEGASVRVPTEKIDKLIDLVGEMVIAHSITTRLVEHISPDTLNSLQESVASLERHIRELHERTMSVRMLPLGSLFSRFHRLVHDLGEKTGKHIKLITEGDETEVDRSILELLGDPLTHVLRNSADHGIETPDVRTKAGKSELGTITLRASHLAGNILIEVIDDGAGLNLERIREKAVSKALIAADAKLTDEQIRMLIFEPGFSTKDQVSDLSGRGVGMDVVQKNVAALNGSISLDSTYGNGTHIRIQLPLTLAIMEGLIVRVETHSFVVPLVSILETVCLERDQVYNVAGQGEVAIVREEAIPFLRLKKMFGLQPSSEAIETQLGDRELVVVVEHSNQRAALEIDELLGQQQIVVKSLERNFEKLDGTLGATILGDGKAALILDAQALVLRRSRNTLSDGRARMSLVA